jgi:hypothetical protein
MEEEKTVNSTTPKNRCRPSFPCPQAEGLAFRVNATFSQTVSGSLSLKTIRQTQSESASGSETEQHLHPKNRVGLLGNAFAMLRTAFALLGAAAATALDNGLARTPPMGWSE